MKYCAKIQSGEFRIRIFIKIYVEAVYIYCYYSSRILEPWTTVDYIYSLRWSRNVLKILNKVLVASQLLHFCGYWHVDIHFICIRTYTMTLQFLSKNTVTTISKYTGIYRNPYKLTSRHLGNETSMKEFRWIHLDEIIVQTSTPYRIVAFWKVWNKTDVSIIEISHFPDGSADCNLSACKKGLHRLTLSFSWRWSKR